MITYLGMRSAQDRGYYACRFQNLLLCCFCSLQLTHQFPCRGYYTLQWENSSPGSLVRKIISWKALSLFGHDLFYVSLFCLLSTFRPRKSGYGEDNSLALPDMLHVQLRLVALPDVAIPWVKLNPSSRRALSTVGVNHIEKFIEFVSHFI